MIPTAHAASPPTYVALGDSVAAGAGLPNSDGTVCDRSTQAYPYRVAAGLNTSVTQLACSGAKVNDGIYGDQERGGVKISPQLDAAFASGTPGIITMTVGANDVRWTQFLTKCQVATCGTAFDDATAKVLRADLRVELYWALHKIEQKSNGKPPTVLLNGYYAPIADTVCPGTERITAAERSWIRARTADLNQAIYSVTPWFSFAHYVPVSFAGHEVCSSAPWIQGLSDPAPFHPYATGQDAIARANLRALGR
jgi:lysophospholipase L1-like esterase